MQGFWDCMSLWKLLLKGKKGCHVSSCRVRRLMKKKLPQAWRKSAVDLEDCLKQERSLYKQAKHTYAAQWRKDFLTVQTKDAKKHQWKSRKARDRFFRLQQMKQREEARHRCCAQSKGSTGDLQAIQIEEHLSDGTTSLRTITDRRLVEDGCMQETRHAMIKHERRHSPVHLQVSKDDHVYFWPRNPENKGSKPHGLHNGHFKAAIQSPSIAYCDALFRNIPLTTGFVPLQWQNLMNFAIKKKPGDFRLSKMRTIQLMNSEAQANNKKAGRAAMQFAEAHSLIPDGQCGSCKRHQAIDLALSKQLVWDLLILQRRAAGWISNDAKSCFDWVAIVTMLLFGLTWHVLSSMFNMLSFATRRICTGFGDSKRSFCPPSAVPFQGCGQGNGAAPHLDLGDTVHHSGEDICASVQAAATLWLGGIRATGGAINPEKSFWWLIDFEWDARNGQWRFCRKCSAAPEFDLKIPGLYSDIEPLRRLEPDDSERTLGVMLSPLENHNAQEAQLVSKGLGVPHLFGKQVYKHLEMILRHMLGGTKPGAYMDANLQAHQLETGTSFGLLQQDYQNTSILASDTWLKRVWKELESLDMYVAFDSPALSLRWHHDALLIDLFIDLEVDQDDLLWLNWCRMFLQVATVSDITTADGRYIRQCIWNGFRDDTYRTPYNWPRTVRPGRPYWELWQRTLSRALLPSHGQHHPLLQPLGHWHDNFESWNWLWSPTVGLFHREGAAWTHLALAGSSTISRRYAPSGSHSGTDSLQ
ncbi:unnamed protein product [Cylindrotheca closterium]|uniref:Uncharacterized protein n=1 Tax=Cylindrotheca closterium TaxID=2856 RepID=A0AAD2JJT4_9STRA|nr:unnamed protein product [Cylindrotheca closterium]